jgi:predicted nucleic acid-binding protein
MALLKDEPAAGRVEAGVDRGDALMSVVNLGEVYYNLLRDMDMEPAAEAISESRATIRIVPAGWRVTKLASEIRVRGKLSYADAFCVATAQRHRAPLWTGDPEMIALANEVEIVDLR